MESPSSVRGLLVAMQHKLPVIDGLRICLRVSETSVLIDGDRQVSRTFCFMSFQIGHASEIESVSDLPPHVGPERESKTDAVLDAWMFCAERLAKRLTSERDALRAEVEQAREAMRRADLDPTLSMASAIETLDEQFTDAIERQGQLEALRCDQGGAERERDLLRVERDAALRRSAKSEAEQERVAECMRELRQELADEKAKTTNALRISTELTNALK